MDTNTIVAIVLLSIAGVLGIGLAIYLIVLHKRIKYHKACEEYYGKDFEEMLEECEEQGCAVCGKKFDENEEVLAVGNQKKLLYICKDCYDKLTETPEDVDKNIKKLLDIKDQD